MTSLNEPDGTPRPGDPQTLPVDVRLNLKEQELRITWGDGRQSRYSLGRLRGLCPCAACRTERDRQKREPLPILSTKPIDDLRAVDGAPVGNYAVQITWSDGHNTGIFDFRYLRSLDEPA